MRKLGIVVLCLLAIFGLARAADVENPFRPPAITCTNQFIRSIAVFTGVGTCASVTAADLATSLYTATTWTPTITTTGTVGTPAYSAQVGSYEQIGRQITVRFNILLSGWTGSPTGNVAIGGLPVTSTATADDVGVCSIGFYAAAGLGALQYGLTGYVDPGATIARIMQNTNINSTSLTAAQAGATFNIYGMCNYRI